MESAMDILTDQLLKSGLAMEEIDRLLARFLEEEAFDYVHFIEEKIWGEACCEQDL